MTERPIMLDGREVRALLAGTKTQTRRVVKSVELARGEARGVRVAPGTFCYLDFDGVPGLSWRPFGGSPTVPYPRETKVLADLRSGILPSETHTGASAPRPSGETP